MDKIKLRITVVTALAVFLLKGTDTFAQQTDPTLTGAVFAQPSTLKNIYDKRQKAHEKIIAAAGDGTCTESGSFLYFHAQYRQYHH